MKTIKLLLEKQLFGVCTLIGQKLGINTSRIRLYFIYISFLGLGSPVVIYFIIAFWLNLKNYIIEHKRSVWDL